MLRRAASLVLIGIDGQKGTHVDKARKNALGVYDATGSVLTAIALSNHDIDVLNPNVDPPQVNDTRTRAGSGEAGGRGW